MRWPSGHAIARMACVTFSRRRAVGAIGIAGVVIPAAGLLASPIWAFPGTHESGRDIAVWAVRHEGRLQVVMVLNTLGVTLWLAFSAALRALMRQVMPPSSVLPDLFGAGMVATATLLLAGFSAFDVLVYRATVLAGPESRVLYDLAFGLLAMSGMPTAIGLTAFAVAVWRERFVSRYLAVLAGVTAMAHVVLLASLIVPSGHLSLEDWPITVIPALLWAWVLATGVALATGSDTTGRSQNA
jgi:hypothetical protein